jgi:hypothetical protein
MLSLIKYKFVKALNLLIPGSSKSLVVKKKNKSCFKIFFFFFFGQLKLAL